MDKLAIDIVGWVGTLFDLSAFLLVSTSKLKGDALPYQLINLFGGLLLTVNAVYYGSISAIAVNIAWTGIAIFTLGQIARSKR